MTIRQSVTTEWVEALPIGTPLHCTDQHDRTFLALKTGNRQTHGRDVWTTTDHRSLLSSAITVSRPVRLVQEAGA
jgi:hypothetical protein